MKKFLSLMLILVLIISSAISVFAEENNYEKLDIGSYGTAVKELQQRLFDLDYLERSGIDGSYGKGTAKAVSAFQAAMDLEETGIADNATQKALYSDSALSLAESILSKRVRNLSEVAGIENYDFHAKVQGGNYVFTVTPYWGKLDFPSDHGVKCYIPDGAKTKNLPYQEKLKPVIDLIEKKVTDEEEHEWRCIAVEMATNGAPGYAYSHALTDYYDANNWDSTYSLIELEGMGKAESHKVIWDGKEQTVYGISTLKVNSATEVVTIMQMYYVPIGYDGIVYLVDDNSVHFDSPDKYSAGMNVFHFITDNSLLFRMK